MKILISAVAIKNKEEGGSTRHLRGFISGLDKLDKKNRYFLCINEGFSISINNPSIKILTFNIKSSLSRFYWDQIKIRKLIKKYEIELVISLFNFGCINSPVKQINFQCGPTYFCKYYLKNLSLKEKITTFIRRTILYLTMKSSTVTVIPTIAMRDMIRNFYSSIPKNKFTIIPHGFDKKIFCQSKKLSQNIQEKIKHIAEDTTKILYVSRLYSYKGYDVLINTAKKLKDCGLRFKLIMTMERNDLPCEFDKYASMINQYKLEEYIMILNRIPEDSVANLYKQCDIFVFPSLCESFGFPMVEAMGLGLPVVAAGTNVNKEICGEAAVYYNPSDYNEAAEKIRLLINDKALRDKIVEKSVLQLANYHINWDLYATKIIDIVESYNGS